MDFYTKNEVSSEKNSIKLLQLSTSMIYLKGGPFLSLTLKNIFVKCMHAFRHDDRQCSSTEKARAQHSHQL